MKKGIVLKGLLVLSLIAGMLLIPGKQTKADTMVDPVVIDFPEDAHVAIGMDLNDLLPLITVNQSYSRGVYTVAELPANAKTTADEQYEGYFVGKRKLGSADSSYDSVNLNTNPEIEANYEYSVQFYYRPVDGISISSSADVSHTLVNNEPVNNVALAGVGSKYRQVIITLSPADWGSTSFDISSGQAQLKNRDSGVVLQRTLLKLGNGDVPGPFTSRSEDNKTYVDLDKDGSDDIMVKIGAKNSVTQIISKLDGASVKEGKFEFTVPKTDMPYNGEGICCNKSVYSTVTLNLGGTGNGNATPTPAPTAAPTTVPDQTNTGNTVVPNTNANTNSAVQTGKTGSDDGVEIEKVNLPKAVIKSCKAKSGRKILLKWKSINAADGYQIAYSTDKSFKKGVKIKKSEKTSITLKGLKKGKVYYVRVCAYVDDEGKVTTGKWSVAKRIKVKK